MYVALLGRQPALGIAELERVFGGNAVTPLSNLAATIDTDTLDISTFGGTLKAGIIIIDMPSGDWNKVSQKVIQHYSTKLSNSESKITLGISSYGFANTSREVQKVGIILKQKLKQSGVSLRIVPNLEPALSTATSHHNKLGLSSNKIEIIIVKSSNGRLIVAESAGAQNITAYTRRDQARPKRDAFVGMLPPKLAQIMINLAVGPVVASNRTADVTTVNDPLQPKSKPTSGPDLDIERGKITNNRAPKDELNKQTRILDPFCGTGVILQEATLKGYSVYGTDIVDKMISYSRDNLTWLEQTHHITVKAQLHTGDAMATKWQQPIDAVVAETYLGQPFSAPPSPAKLAEVRKTCNHIITEFLRNLSSQIAPGTPVCIAVPAWRAVDGSFTHLPLTATIAQLGFKPHEFHNISQNDLLYFREDQIVARELLVLTKI